MSLSKLSMLPPEVLSSVLNNRAIPLGRRLRLRLISNHWCDIIEEGLRKKRELVICEKNTERPKGKPDDLDQIVDLVIKTGDLIDEHTHLLARLFPGTTQLTLSFGVNNHSASWSAVPSLLAHLATNLTTVKLLGYISPAEAHEPYTAALTALSALTSFTLVGTNLSGHLLPHLGTVLSRLEAFACPYVFYPPIISSSLSPRCTHLLLDSYAFSGFPPSFLAQLSTSLTHLHLVSYHSLDWPSLSQMHGLTSLTLVPTNYTELDASLFSQLALSRLTNVKLFKLTYGTPLGLPSNKEFPLSSIKRLSLEVDFGKSSVDYQAFFKAISAWFSTLSHLTLITLPDTFPTIQASPDQLAFSVELVDPQTVDTLSPDW